MSKKNSSNIATIKWKGSAGIEQSLSLHKELLKVFKTKEEILLDISELEKYGKTAVNYNRDIEIYPVHGSKVSI